MMLSLAFLATAVAVAPPPPAPPAPQDAQLAELLDLVMPTETILAANLAAWRETLTGRFDEDAKLVAREKAEPGLRARAIAAGLAVVESEYRRTIRDLRGKAGAIYADTLTPVEMGELIAFFRTPTGDKLVRGMAEGIAGSSKLTAEGVHADGKRKAATSMDESDRPALESFAKTSAFRKTGEVSPKIAAISNEGIMAVTARLLDNVPAAWKRALGTQPAAAH